jgi:hypothetical protein
MKEHEKEADEISETKPLPTIPAPNADDPTRKMRVLSGQDIEQILKRKMPRPPE